MDYCEHPQENVLVKRQSHTRVLQLSQRANCIMKFTTHPSLAMSPAKSGLPRKLVSRLLLVGFVVALLPALSSYAAGITNNWLSTSDSYTNKTSWDAGVLPTVTDTATVGNAFQLNGVVLYTNALGDPAGSN